MVVSEKSFVGYGSYREETRVPLSVAISRFLSEANARISMHTSGMNEIAVQRTRRMSHKEAVRKCGAKFARKFGY
ncbi:MAG: hypothetical protein WCV80_01950 [Candidatus Paceibacterota bacterium]|jgi:hypothetical protein